MEILFRDEKLRRLVSDEKSLKKRFGQYAKYVRMRIDLLRAAETLADVPHHPPARRHRKDGTTKTFIIDVKTKHDKWRIEFDVANDPVPKKEDGSIDLNAVTAVEIIEVSNHYGD
jgi:toxin HigB-1